MYKIMFINLNEVLSNQKGTYLNDLISNRVEILTANSQLSTLGCFLIKK